MASHLTKRGTVYYCVARVNGKRVSISTGESTEAGARAVASRVLKAARAQRWEALDDVKGRRERPATIGEICDRYRQLAAEQRRRAGKPRPETVEQYVWGMTYLIQSVRGCERDAVRELPATVLCGDTLDRYVSLAVPESGSNAEMDRARRSASSIVRGARQVFSRWAWPGYADLELPDLVAFRSAPTVRAPVRPYELPPEALRAALHAGAEALRAAGDPMYAVYCLVYYLGLRAGEAAQCRWSWFREEGGRRYLDVGNDQSGEWKTKSGRRRSVPVAAGVWERLRAARVGSEWVLDAATPTGRKNLVQRRYSRWMRGLGWDRRRFPKAAHECRKLIGSEWYTRYGVEVAAEWLGHADLKTTRDYYAALMRHPEPIDPDTMEV